jgi:CheY-like chemotaxis protein
MDLRTILLVEDHAAVRKLVRLALEGAGMRVLEAENGASALALLASARPQLVIQDLALPDMDGFDLVHRLRRAREHDPISVLAFSGLLSNLDQGRIFAAGFDDVIPKPCDPSTLVSIVESHLPGRATAAGRFGEGKRVVVADDDPGQLRLTVVRLSSLGFSVVEARDGVEALALIREQRPDVVVSDVMMPRMDGFDLAFSLRKDPEQRQVPLVLLSSSYIEENDRDLARNAGADEFVLRTPDLRGLIEALHRALGDRAHGVAVTTLPPHELKQRHSERVVRQLERQVRHNAALMRRCAALSTELNILRRISEALLRHRDVENELDDVLATCFEAGAASSGALYLQDPDGHLRAIPLGVTRFTAHDLQDFFGHQRWLL